jgi:hypothetical protein
MPFDPTLIVLAEAGPETPDDWVMAAPLSWQGEFRGRPGTLGVPACELPFTTDLASVPRFLTWLFPRYGNYTKAAVLHDYFCRRFSNAVVWVAPRPSSPDAAPAAPAAIELEDRSDADEVFQLTMRELGVPWARRRLMWSAVTWATLVTSIVPGRSSNTIRRVLAALVILAALTGGWFALGAGWWGGAVDGGWAWLRVIVATWVAVAAATFAGLLAGYVALGRWERWWELLLVWGMTVASVPLLAAGLEVAVLLVLYLLFEDAFNGFRGLRTRARGLLGGGEHGRTSAQQERLEEVKAS